MAKKSKQKFQASESFPETRKQVEIKYKNQTQKHYHREIEQNDITFGIGPAGTGKTYLAALIAMKKFTEGEVDKIVICRPAIPAGGEDIGFLPGAINDKMYPYIRPILDAFQTYWSPQTIQQYLKEGLIEIVPLAYMRGRTFANAFVLADEIQNADSDKLLMLLTRLGEGSKMVVTGDPIQSDVNGHSCFHTAEGILAPVDTIGFVKFQGKDIVRHPTVEQIQRVWPSSEIGFDHVPAFINAA